MENKEIKIIRLKSGEDVIATFTENKKEKRVTLENPMHIIFKRSPTSEGITPMMYMYPWVPVEMVEKDIAFIDSVNVLTTFQPKGEMIEYYENVIIDAKERAKKLGDQKVFEEDIEYDDDIDEIKEALRERKTKKMVH
jgi:hypothetical protein